jgi:lipopolysaccharide export system protein LptA
VSVRAIGRSLGLLAAIIAGCALSAAAAQTTTTPAAPGAFRGFSNERDKPIHITAATLEVRDKDRKATFRGAVQVIQGDTTLKCKMLDVYYEQGVGGGAQAEQGAQQQVRRLEAKGDVHVTQKDQTATGDSGIFDIRANTVTLIGNVVVTQGGNVVRGERLVVDLTTGVSRVEPGRANDGRVQGLFLPNSARESTGQIKDVPKPAPRPGASAPLKLN